MNAELLPPAIANFSDSGLIENGDIVRLRSLVRGPIVAGIFSKGRRVHRFKQPYLSHGFCIMRNGSMSSREGSSDDYLTVHMQEFGDNVSGINIRLLKNRMSDDSTDNGSTMYQFRWTPTLALGRTATWLRSQVDTAIAVDDGPTVVMDSSNTESVLVHNPVTELDLDVMQVRMEQIIAGSHSRRITPSRIMQRVDYYRELHEDNPNRYVAA